MRYEEALQFVLDREGGFSDDPADPGGATLHGITQGTYDGWRLSQKLPTRSVRLMTNAEEGSIYRGLYWLPAYCGDCPTVLQLMQFDTAVNMGVSRALKLLQASLGVTVDGSVGPKTLEALRDCKPEPTLRNYHARRVATYQALIAINPKLAKYRKGWIRRAGLALDRCLKEV